MTKPIFIFMLLFLISGCWNSDTKGTSTGEVEIINGHTLPPDPGEAGKVTLLGIDCNDDGVRDDVERYIYHRFSKEEYPKTKIAIALQYGRAVQNILVDPEHGYENGTSHYLEKAHDCQWYFYRMRTKGKSFSDFLNFRKQNPLFDEEFEDHVFNTEQRLKAYFTFNSSLSGHTFPGRKKSVDKCDIDIEKLDE
ncbi:hypothetical protein WCX49_07340 [Sulfurimonas sp. HSL-1656]|uniref:hypothetical protein n=1 Tax=Thiomicrolovo subterrani TaxID=3131934 RepID=UPI0031F835C8